MLDKDRFLLVGDRSKCGRDDLDMDLGAAQPAYQLYGSNGYTHTHTH